MAATVNRMTDEWMQERTQAPLDKMKDWISKSARDLGGPLFTAVQDRIGVAAAGKRMLDEGGEAAELGVLAKKIALDAVALDDSIIEHIQNVVALYREAASLLHDQSSGLAVLGRLAEDYVARSNFYAKILENIGEAPQEPPVSDVELDAMQLIKLRQAKAEMGLRPQVGGSSSGRHGNSFFCVTRDDRPQRSAIAPRQATEEVHLAPQSSSTPSVTDWTMSHDSLQDSRVSFSNPQHSFQVQTQEAPGEAAIAQSNDFAKQPVGGTMASKVESMGKAAQEEKAAEGALPRGDTLDTLNTVLDNLDTLKTVIDTMDASAPAQNRKSETSAEVNHIAYNDDNAACGLAEKAVSPNGFVSKDAERQAASRQVLQETLRSTAPTTSPNRSSMQPEARQQKEPPSDAASVVPKDSLEVQYPRLNTSFDVGSVGPYPGLDTSPISYAVEAGRITAPQSSSSSFGASDGCAYKVGYAVEIFSKSSEAWVKGSVVRVEGSMLTVQYGDRERKVDLKSKCLSEIFRLPVEYTATAAPAFDSMLTNPGEYGAGNQLPGTEISIEPRFTKAAVL